MIKSLATLTEALTALEINMRTVSTIFQCKYCKHQMRIDDLIMPKFECVTRIKKECSAFFDFMRKSNQSLKLLMPHINYEESMRLSLEKVNLRAPHYTDIEVIPRLVSCYDCEFINARILHTIFIASQSLIIPFLDRS